MAETTISKHMEPKQFKKGDTVVVIGPRNGDWDAHESIGFTDTMQQNVGHTAIITGVTAMGCMAYQLDNCEQWYAEEWLEIYEDLHTPGAKDDAAKPPVALVFESFPKALLEVAKVAGYGEKKYTRGGWRHVPDAAIRYADAAARHELARYDTGDIDTESGFLHLAHQTWNILALLELKLNE